MARSPHGRRPPRLAPVVPLTIDVRREGAHSVYLRVAGELDQDTAPQLRRAVTAALRGRPTDLHLDLAAVPFTDSAGLHVLLDARSRLRDWGGTLTVDAGEQVRELLRLTGTTPLFTVVRSVPGPTA